MVDTEKTKFALCFSIEWNDGGFFMSKTQPNIIIILADDLGYGDVSCFGSETINTPNIDRLAREGIRFTDFHSNGAVCSPTRAAMLTGGYQQRTGVTGVITAKNHRDKGLCPEKFTTFAKMMGGVGYRTALFGKWHVGYDAKFNPTLHGFDEFRGFVAGNVDYFSHVDQVGYLDWWNDGIIENEEGYTTDLVTCHGIDFINRNKENPFVLYLAHECPHYPYQGPNDEGYRVANGNTAPALGPREDQDVAYIEMMEAMDQGIGEVIASVEENGLAENTLVIFFSDNGPAGVGSSGGFRGQKGSVFEGGHRMPAAAWWPGKIQPGQICETPCLGMDLFPTMATLGGAQLPEGQVIDGVDLSPILFESGELAPRPLYWSTRKEGAVRDADYKFVLDKETGEEMLFNLNADPFEAKNIASNNLNKVIFMRKKYDSWYEEVSSGVEQQS